MSEEVERRAKLLFDIWRTDQTGDVWRQLSAETQEAWRRVARWTL